MRATNHFLPTTPFAGGIFTTFMLAQLDRDLLTENSWKQLRTPQPNEKSAACSLWPRPPSPATLNPDISN
ncbi:MAG: hypothetical protein Q4D79_03710 [Propionibacteriaceae bacterium]|nr:hypothetical protein [Propionibacteriaceae bacterium]